jgi:Tol biopolymer transport system component
MLASVSDKYDENVGRYEKGICVLDANTSGCDTFVAEELGYDLYDPALSPNGKLLAVTRALPGKTLGQIALYDYASGALVRTLTNATTDSGPVWSPDGSKLAFVRAGKSIYTVGVGGGTARQLVAKGRAVTWGQ